MNQFLQKRFIYVCLHVFVCVRVCVCMYMSMYVRACIESLFEMYIKFANTGIYY